MQEQRSDDDLAGWCRRLGLQPGYDDIWGGHHPAPEDRLRALLAELGVHDTSAAALQAAEDDDWRRPLPPVLAITAGAPDWSLPVRLDGDRRLGWTVVTEDGRRHQGDAAPGPSTLQAEREVGGARLQAHALSLGLSLPAGYHRLTVDGLDGETLLIAAPPRCWRPAALQGEGRVWGPAVQLYAVRSERNWGMGDFGDLAALVEHWGARGAGIVGLNPLHALFGHNPWHISPYSPSSRGQLHTLYLDVEALDDFRECEPAQALVRSAGFQARLAALREAEQVDHAGVAAAKREVLGLLHRHFRERHLRTASPRGEAFRAFCRERGEALHGFALFEALQQHFHDRDRQVWGWPVWPEAYRDPRGEAVRRFAEEQAAQVEFHAWLQWQADTQLAAVNRRCRERGLAVGLYLDLAVSVDRAGADTWLRQDLYAVNVSVGAPPDELNLQGQNWGLPPLKPAAMRDDRHGFFIETLRGCMRHAGAIRIDHVMGLMRLFWIPEGGTGRDGAYVHYPLQELMAIVALESERQRCMVIGEDLGTVADEMRATLAEREVLSYRLAYFERQDGGAFKPPADYPREALVAVGTHDLATLPGWWTGHDIEVRRALDLYPTPQVYEEQLVQRTQDRLRLLFALHHAGLLPEGVPLEPGAAVPLTTELATAVQAWLAAAPSRVMVVQLEDVLGVPDQANLPGTVNEHPNWRRKLPATLEAMQRDERIERLAERLAAIRPHAPLATAAPPRAEAIVPRATYRLQLHQDFTLDDARLVLPYLKRLGVSHVYCSPLMRARPGSRHGYDVVAHDEINPELGGREAFDRFTEAVKAEGMGLLIDLVPNHMGVLGGDNAWWMDVLENGEASPYARYFDIAWHPVDPELDGKVLVPVLGKSFGAVLEDGELTLAFEPEAGSFALRYWDHRFPLGPRSVAPVLKRAAERLGGDSAGQVVLASLAAAFGHLPPREVDDPDARRERARDKELLKLRLATAVETDPTVGAAIEAAVAEFNASADALAALHDQQAYRLAFWRVASDEINYRRFFDVNDLAALRQEEPAVFEATNGFALELAAAGKVDGLRIDHPDGLHDPAQYFRRLQEGYARRVGLVLPRQDADGRPPRPLYVLAEKIAAGHEDVPLDWALHGTTGYRFANLANGVLVDTTARERFDRIWAHHTGDRRDFEALAHEGKHLIMRTTLASELNVLSTELLRIARAHRRTRDFTLNTLRRALAQVAACMPVYRTYLVDEEGAQPSEQDQRFIAWALGQARRHREAAEPEVLDFLQQTLLARAVEGAPPGLQAQVRRFAVRFQQFSAPVTAKGVEDTAFYRYSRLVSLNEVGGEPGVFGITVKAFHAATADRWAKWPHTLIATSTHDNKRSEDVRCRIDVLSEMPAAWRFALRRWRRMAAEQRLPVGPDGPSPADELLLWQVILGTLPPGGLTEEALPDYRDRIEAYALKAAREAKRDTSWLHPDEAYEARLSGFVRGLFARVSPNPLLTDVQARAEVVAWFGALNSLVLTTLRCTAPGVPDCYQGNEWLDFSLVDPDNRRPVDYGLRERALDALQAWGDQADPAAAMAAAIGSPHDGRLKLWVTWRLLQLRAGLSDVFKLGGYLPLTAEGDKAEHVLAFERRLGDQRVVVVVGRLFAKLLSEPGWPVRADAWGDTRLVAEAVEGDWHDVLSGHRCRPEASGWPLAQVFSHLPVAVLVGPGAVQR
ncbi:malto-oligosyltrehalose synthase [Aquabacterium sp. J223]|uniref:malto-oligosyltrehalose synthase n=1 Tax=Aquabacterium sp. J223 TaxID=2898431 RepID=UPI0021ADF2CC|nr:malto-oligosyltrehalose synthase [Aquabacterium sp. J223]UUX95098.1 malto-oligosyltrehalose synthase [Aquabacterium sp. J223]